MTAETKAQPHKVKVDNKFIENLNRTSGIRLVIAASSDATLCCEDAAFILILIEGQFVAHCSTWQASLDTQWIFLDVQTYIFFKCHLATSSLKATPPCSPSFWFYKPILLCCIVVTLYFSSMNEDYDFLWFLHPLSGIVLCMDIQLKAFLTVGSGRPSDFISSFVISKHIMVDYR